MNRYRNFFIAALFALAACKQSPPLTIQQIESVKGLGMDAVRAKIGGPHVVTDAGESVWWDYDNVTTSDGKPANNCQVIFKKGIVAEVHC